MKMVLLRKLQCCFVLDGEVCGNGPITPYGPKSIAGATRFVPNLNRVVLDSRSDRFLNFLQQFARG
jgi:hypothetical protein